MFYGSAGLKVSVECVGAGQGRVCMRVYFSTHSFCAGWDPALLQQCAQNEAHICSLDGLLRSSELQQHVRCAAPLLGSTARTGADATKHLHDACWFLVRLAALCDCAGDIGCVLGVSCLVWLAAAHLQV